MQMKTAMVYIPFLEDTDSELRKGWDKLTVDYVINNKDKVLKRIKALCSKYTNLCHMDIEDIYQNLLEYLYKAEDYNKIISDGIVVPLEGYLNNSIKNAIKRYVTKRASQVTYSDVVLNEDKELSIYNYIPDDSAELEIEEKTMYNLEDLCSYYEHQRYRYGFDVFMLFYVRLLTLRYNIDDLFDEIAKICIGNKKDLGNIDYNKDEMFLSIAKAITLCGIDKAISVLEKYVYGKDKIKDLIMQYYRGKIQ